MAKLHIWWARIFKEHYDEPLPREWTAIALLASFLSVIAAFLLDGKSFPGSDFVTNVLASIFLLGPGLVLTNVLARHWRERRIQKLLSPDIAFICATFNAEYASPALKFAVAQAEGDDIPLDVSSRQMAVDDKVDFRGMAAIEAITYVTQRIDEVQRLLPMTLMGSHEKVAPLAMGHIRHLAPLVESLLFNLSRHMRVDMSQQLLRDFSDELWLENIPVEIEGEQCRVSANWLLRSVADTTRSDFTVAYGQIVATIMGLGFRLQGVLKRLRDEVPGA